MKKLFLYLIVPVLGIICSNDCLSQNRIPAYCESVSIGETFEEALFSESIPDVREEREIIITVLNVTNENEHCIIEYYAIDGSFVSEPFYVDELSSLHIQIDNKKYGVKILDKSTYCEVTIVIE
jgi:hypothetical protein